MDAQLREVAHWGHQENVLEAWRQPPSAPIIHISSEHVNGAKDASARVPLSPFPPLSPILTLTLRLGQPDSGRNVGASTGETRVGHRVRTPAGQPPLPLAHIPTGFGLRCV